MFESCPLFTLQSNELIVQHLPKAEQWASEGIIINSWRGPLEHSRRGLPSPRLGGGAGGHLSRLLSTPPRWTLIASPFLAVPGSSHTFPAPDLESQVTLVWFSGKRRPHQRALGVLSAIGWSLCLGIFSRWPVIFCFDFFFFKVKCTNEFLLWLPI